MPEMPTISTKRHTLAYAAALISMTLSSSVMAASADYRFELDGPPTKSGKTTIQKVRLVHIPTGKAVPNAEIVETTFDMGPDGMAGMKAPAMPAAQSDPGFHVIELQPSMAGNWGLSLAAKVPGEPETIRSTLTVVVPK
tara:strand:+ start:70 stop:486 length:417 start_codon:yes stop_codon:yes gene_type:complete